MLKYENMSFNLVLWHPERKHLPQLICLLTYCNFICRQYTAGYGFTVKVLALHKFLVTRLSCNAGVNFSWLVLGVYILNVARLALV